MKPLQRLGNLYFSLTNSMNNSNNSSMLSLKLMMKWQSSMNLLVKMEEKRNQLLLLGRTPLEVFTVVKLKKFKT